MIPVPANSRWLQRSRLARNVRADLAGTGWKRLPILAALLVVCATPALASVTFDNVWQGSNGSNSPYTVSISPAAGHANYTLVLFSTEINVGASGDAVSTVAGAGCTWSKFGATQTGNGGATAEVWACTGNSTGAQTITVTYNHSILNSSTDGVVVSLFGVNQSTPLSGLASATSGSLNISVTSGDVALSAQFDNNNNRSVTGCTSSTDISAFGNMGYSEAHCTSSPTSTFTWSGFGTNSIAVGVDVQASGGAAAPAGINKKNKLEKLAVQAGS